MFDATVPKDLLQLQKWFADFIIFPLEKPDSPSALSKDKKLRKKAHGYITPNQALNSEQRIEIYQQQYWWRLLSILQKTYPAITRLFGHAVFNQTIAAPYLLKHPSKTWDLNYLGKGLPRWLSRNYEASDQALIVSMAEIDLAYEESFVAATLPSLEESVALVDVSKLLAQKIHFQPHVKTFKLPFHLFHLRQALLKESVAYWESHPLPKLAQDKTYYFILYRNEHNKIVWEEIAQGAWVLISFMQKGLSLEEACLKIEKLGGVVEEEAERHLALWLHHWVKERLLTK